MTNCWPNSNTCSSTCNQFPTRYLFKACHATEGQDQRLAIKPTTPAYALLWSGHGAHHLPWAHRRWWWKYLRGARFEKETGHGLRLVLTPRASTALSSPGYPDASRGSWAARPRWCANGCGVRGISRSWKWHSDDCQGDTAAAAVAVWTYRVWAPPEIANGARAHCSSGFAMGV